MAKTYIFTVGTSLLQKPKLTGLIQDIKYLSGNNKDIIEKDDYKTNYTFITANSYLSNANNLKDFTAEIATLKLISEFDISSDKIVLLSSDTPDGAFCTRVNYEYMKEKMQIKNIEMQLIDDTDINKPVEFVKKGLINLSDYLKGQVTTDLILCFTGGYKALIPVLTLFAFTKNIPMFYLFEPEVENPELIKITIENKDNNKDIKNDGKESEPENMEQINISDVLKMKVVRIKFKDSSL